jgi:hypothetical protein
MATMKRVLPKFLGHAVARALEGGPSRACHLSAMSGRLHLGLQMLGTEEIRFKLGDACCSILDRV